MTCLQIQNPICAITLPFLAKLKGQPRLLLVTYTKQWPYHRNGTKLEMLMGPEFLGPEIYSQS